jgi:hypothetical protein
MPLKQALTRSVAEEMGGPRAVRFDPDARAYEAFVSGTGHGGSKLLDPLKATTLDEALAEVTERWAFDRGDRFQIREIGSTDSSFYPFGKVGVDLLHVYAVRRTGRGIWHPDRPMTYNKSVDHICTIDLNVVIGAPVDLYGVERDQFERRQAQRPEGARR